MILHRGIAIRDGVVYCLMAAVRRVSLDAITNGLRLEWEKALPTFIEKGMKRWWQWRSMQKMNGRMAADCTKVW